MGSYNHAEMKTHEGRHLLAFLDSLFDPDSVSSHHAGLSATGSDEPNPLESFAGNSGTLSVRLSSRGLPLDENWHGDRQDDHHVKDQRCCDQGDVPTPHEGDNDSCPYGAVELQECAQSL